MGNPGIMILEGITFEPRLRLSLLFVAHKFDPGALIANSSPIVWEYTKTFKPPSVFSS